MNYMALTVDELRALCIVDAGARKYAGEHFGELLDREEEERMAEWEISQHDPFGLNHALTWDHDAIDGNSMWWRIG